MDRLTPEKVEQGYDYKGKLAKARAAMAELLEVLDNITVAEAKKAGQSILTLAEAAKRLRCSPQTVRRGARFGRYPFMVRDGKRLIASEEKLEKWLKTRA